jgi:hypothetical protein
VVSGRVAALALKLRHMAEDMARDQLAEAEAHARAYVPPLPTPYTLHPTPYTLHPTPYTLHPTPYILHPTPYTLHPTPSTTLPKHTVFIDNTLFPEPNMNKT